MIKTLILENVRLYQSLQLDVHPRLNIVTGDNAQGKTTLLEAIYLLAYTKSHRTYQEKEVIQKDALYAKIECVTKEERLKLVISDSGKNVYLNDHSQDKLSQFIGHIVAVMFSPEDFNLIKGAPKLRRTFLDMQGSINHKGLMTELVRYKKLLKDRNHHLKTLKDKKIANEDVLLKVLTQRLAYSNEQIMMARKSFLTALSLRLTKIYQSIAEDGLSPVIQYIPSLPFNDIEASMMHHLQKDIYTETTNYGIHRDDFRILSEGEAFENHASQGQIRTLGIAIKLALVEWLKDVHQIHPIVLLDDVFSELDQKRQNALLELVQNESQVFITATDINLIRRENLKDYSQIEIHEGKVKVKL